MARQVDLIIRGGTVVDGTGAAPYQADIAVADGRIVQIGKIDAQAAEVLDATGLLVTPGFVDVHTHYDGQVTWANRLAPSSAHGVSTIVMGNCGVGFAPCRPEDRDILVHLMEGVEDIPEPVLVEGLPWNWVSFPDFMNSLDGRHYDIDIAAQLPHAALRIYVMGERAADKQAATDADIAQMAEIAKEAMAAGALGFSTSRSLNHRSSDGSLTPTLLAVEKELTGIALGLKAAGAGVIEMISDFDDPQAEIGLMRRIVEQSGRPLSVCIVQVNHAPDRWKTLLDGIGTANDDGLSIKAQIFPRPAGLLLGFNATFNPFSLCPFYQSIRDQPLAERIAILRRPETRAKLLAEYRVPLSERDAEIKKAFSGRTVGPGMAQMVTKLEGMYLLGAAPNYEPSKEDNLAARAGRERVTPEAFVYDLLLEHDGRALLYVPGSNFSYGNLEPVLAMLRHPNTILGLGDGGAHNGMICDASYPTYMLTHWARDRRGDQLSLPQVIKALTSDTASAVGLNDRGLLAPGYRADINVIDFERLTLKMPEIVADLPGGGQRLIQEAEGYVAAIVNGEVIYRNGEPTGALPGRLVRGARTAATA